jgi:hypothetical protein
MRTLLLLLGLVTGLLACQSEPTPPPKPRNMAPSPFVGFWTSDDNDEKHAYSVRLWQHEDTLFGAYCAVNESLDTAVDCGIVYDDRWNFAFAVDNPTDSTFESGFQAYWSKTYGRLRLTLAHDRLYWRLLQAPTGRHLMPTHSTFRRK